MGMKIEIKQLLMTYAISIGHFITQFSSEKLFLAVDEINTDFQLDDMEGIRYFRVPSSK